MNKIKRTLVRIALVGGMTALAVAVVPAPRAEALNRCQFIYNNCVNTCGGAGNIAFFDCPPFPETPTCECV